MLKPVKILTKNYEIPDSHTLAVDVPREKDLNHLFTLLTAHGINILSMRNKTNRLEELFMGMVNKKAEA
jgi:ABC-2 type transport system ATP-binding protein